MKLTVFCNAEDSISLSLSFFAEKVISELKCTKSLPLELLRTPETDFHEFEFLAEKVILELKCTKNTS